MALKKEIKGYKNTIARTIISKDKFKYQSKSLRQELRQQEKKTILLQQANQQLEKDHKELKKDPKAEAFLKNIPNHNYSSAQIMS